MTEPVWLRDELALVLHDLARNGYRFAAGEAAATCAVLELASGDLTEQAFTCWLAQHSAPV